MQRAAACAVAVVLGAQPRYCSPSASPPSPQCAPTQHGGLRDRALMPWRPALPACSFVLASHVVSVRGCTCAAQTVDQISGDIYYGAAPPAASSRLCALQGAGARRRRRPATISACLACTGCGSIKFCDVEPGCAAVRLRAPREMRTCSAGAPRASPSLPDVTLRAGPGPRVAQGLPRMGHLRATACGCRAATASPRKVRATSAPLLPVSSARRAPSAPPRVRSAAAPRRSLRRRL